MIDTLAHRITEPRTQNSRIRTYHTRVAMTNIGILYFIIRIKIVCVFMSQNPPFYTLFRWPTRSVTSPEISFKSKLALVHSVISSVFWIVHAQLFQLPRFRVVLVEIARIVCRSVAFVADENHEEKEYGEKYCESSDDSVTDGWNLGGDPDQRFVVETEMVKNENIAEIEY